LAARLASSQAVRRDSAHPDGKAKIVAFAAQARPLLSSDWPQPWLSKNTVMEIVRWTAS